MPKFIHFPKFNEGRELVIHTEVPRFIAVVKIANDGGKDINISEAFDKLEPAKMQEYAALMREMGDWYAKNVK